MNYKGKLVYTTDKREFGIATGHTRNCSMEGCNGINIRIKWKDNKVTYLCSKGLVSIEDGNFQIH